MISYLIDGALLTALAATSALVGLMYREIRKLRSHDGEYREILEETGEALEAVEAALRDLSARGTQVAIALGERIDDARATISALEEKARLARAALAGAQAGRERLSLGPGLSHAALVDEAFAPSLSKRLDRPRSAEPQACGIDIPGPAYRAPVMGGRAPSRAPVGPTLGDYLGNWRAARPTDFRRAPLSAERV